MKLDLISDNQVKIIPEYNSKDTCENGPKIVLLSEVDQKAGAVPDMPGVLNQILGMAQDILQASATSILLLDQRSGDLCLHVVKLDGGEFSEQDLKATLSEPFTAALLIENTRLHKDLLDSYKGTIKALAAVIDAKDPYTCGHSQRVMEYALLGGASLSLSRDELEDIEYAGILHDIGKIGIPDSILTKPGALVPEEWNVVREHPRIGADMLDGILFLKEARKLLLHHHERYDGQGYPDGLKGKNIPIGARIIAVADAFDTMTTDRSYRAALSHKNALMELSRCAGRQFCPVAVEALCSGLVKS